MFEVWVSNCTYGEVYRHCLDSHGKMRFNARFSSRARSLIEMRWYQNRGYMVEIREPTKSPSVHTESPAR